MMVSPGSDPVRDLRALLSEGRYQEVLDRHGSTVSEGAGSEPGIAIGVATAATRLGRLDQGETLAGLAEEQYRRRADDDGRLRCLNLLGAIAWERGQVDLATTRWTRALEMARTWRDTLMTARISNNLASALHLGGRGTEARSLYREAMLAYQRLAERRFTAETAHNIAITYRDDGELELAEDACAEAVRQAELVGDGALLALALTGRGETRVAQGDYVLAAADLDRAERLAAEAQDRLGVAEVARVRAVRLLAIGDFTGALAQAGAGRSAAQSLGSALLEAECAAVEVSALNGLGRNREAGERHAVAAAAFRRLGAVAQLDRLGPSPA
jgi:tetratricopeptide (TPR) repeat protein